ncbi:hypothetical protein LTR16_003854, partial [Cryomyces antarcticus]
MVQDEHEPNRSLYIGRPQQQHYGRDLQFEPGAPDNHHPLKYHALRNEIQASRSEGQHRSQRAASLSANSFEDYVLFAMDEEIPNSYFTSMLNLEDDDLVDGPAALFDQMTRLETISNNNASSYPVPSTMLPIVTTKTARSSLISPILTNSRTPSPSRKVEALRTSFSSQDSPPLDAHLSVSQTSSLRQHRTNIGPQQCSPAPSDLSVGGYDPSETMRPASSMRPVVRVELYGREEPPLTTAHARDPSRQGSYSRNSSAHLSPYPADEPWDEECPREDSDLSSEHLVSPLTYLSIHRDDGGSWISDAVSAPAGISPGIREQLNYTPMLTLQERTDQRLVAEKNANVVDWLTHSETGSEVGDGKPHSNITKETQLKNRRRAKSTSDATTNFRSASGLDVNGRLSQQSGLPESSVGFYIDEQGEVDESELSESSIGSESPPAKVDVNEAYNDGSYFPQMGADDSSTLHFYTARPWDDPSAGAEVPVERYQPNTSNAAMMRFSQRAKELDSASLAVTVGSRRRSAGDLDSLFSVKGISKPIIVNEDADA